MNDPSANRTEAGYGFCRQMAKRSGSNFYASFMLLPREKRRAMYALYAFMRHTDDLGDNDEPAEKRREKLRAWRDGFWAAIGEDRAAGDSTVRGETTADSILPAVADTVRRFQIPPEHLDAVIDGVEMDLAPPDYDTFDELAEYCHRVASAVGLACIHIWGFDGPEAVEPARKCGLAMQLTNILRDLKEDADAGRVYLPKADFHIAAYTPEELCHGVTGPGFGRLVEMEFNRAEKLYREGAALFEYLSPDGRRVFGMMMDVYHRLLLKVGSAGPRILDARVRLSRAEKFCIAARWLVFRPRRLEFCTF